MNFRNLKCLVYKLAKEQKNPYARNAYMRIIHTINSFHNETEEANPKKINKLPITDNMKLKLIYLLDKGDCKLELKEDITKILSIGKKKAEELINAGLKSTKDLEKPEFYSLLNTDTQKILAYKPLRRIPHKEIKDIEHLLVGKNATLVGSYRRKQPFSKDIDILLIGRGRKDIDDYITSLTLPTVVISAGQDKASIIIQGKHNYKADIFRAPKSEYFTHLLYATGSKMLNIRMRARAKKMGYLLNQKGLFKNEKKINKPKDDEARLFQLLNMEYVPPELR
jgi:DNA polymerase/3'-5' exonuclease PolX